MRNRKLTSSLIGLACLLAAGGAAGNTKIISIREIKENAEQISFNESIIDLQWLAELENGKADETAEKKETEDTAGPEETENIDETETTADEAEHDIGENAEQKSTMSDKQLSSIAMLNHMTVLTQEINDSANSQLYLDNAYSDIVNNINPNAVDEDTLAQITGLLNTIYTYQSIETKKERLQYIYEQNQADALQKAIPDSTSVFNVLQSDNTLEAIVSVLYMAVDAKTSYDSYLTEIERQYLDDGWTLDDSASKTLHESRKDAFSYMVEMCQKNNLDGKLALSEKAVENFVSWENTKNITRKIEFLENNESTYAAYGKYWLVLAEGYYEQREYQKCLAAMDAYERMNIDTFRKDHDYAKAMSLVLVANNALFSGEEYAARTEECVEKILRNIEPEDWQMRYLVAQVYLDLYTRMKDKGYLQQAFDYTKENVNYLIDTQYNKNAAYLADTAKVEPQKSDSRARKKEIKQYNKLLKKERKTELPPVYQPLVLNCEMLFGLADELDISESEKVEIDQMLHGEDIPLFLVEPLEEKYWFNPDQPFEEADIKFDEDTLEIPASYLMYGCQITTTVYNGDKETQYKDWKIKKVDRKKHGNASDFEAVYKSKKSKKQDYTSDSRVILEIVPPQGSGYDTLTFEFKASENKKLVFFKSIEFEMIK